MGKARGGLSECSDVLELNFYGWFCFGSSAGGCLAGLAIILMLLQSVEAILFDSFLEGETYLLV